MSNAEPMNIGKFAADVGKTAIVSILGGCVVAYVSLSNLVIRVDSLENKIPKIEAKIENFARFDTIHTEKILALERRQEQASTALVELSGQMSNIKERIVRLDVSIHNIESALKTISNDMNFLTRTAPAPKGRVRAD